MNATFCYQTYYSQSCSGANCSIGAWFYNPCQGTSFYGVSTFAMPTTVGFTDAWDNQCAALEARSAMTRRLTRALLVTALILCNTPALAAECQKLSETCVDGPATKTIGGYPVQRECWRYQAQFSCVSQTMVDDCQPLRDRGCSQVESKCIDTSASGACMLLEQTYQCRVASGSTSTITNCGSQQFCMEGNCFDTSHPPDADFAKAVAVLEAQREAGKYLDPNSLVMFNGYDNRCRKKLFGLVNCCSGGGTDGSLFSNLNVILGRADRRSVRLGRATPTMRS